MNEALAIIYNFFPKGIAFDDIKYTTSKEYARLCNKRSEFEGESKFFAKEIQRTLPNYAVVDWTNLAEYNCMQFKVLILENQKIIDDDIQLIQALGGSRIDLMLYVSVLGDFYYYYYVQTSYHDGIWKFKDHLVRNEEMKRISSKIELLMSGKKLIKLEDIICKHVVPDLETELLNFGEVTIFNCLFTEIETV
ncbi:hypothetical protein [Paenibacillus radicis (ex Gao et al. 2016)]|uniref:Uncharacterized protein n=1 Tax=Paenibacillus radicis (ex Gao et al. 2016) TaxID=1737354 RepID=A0A917M2I3_9BACL|nr:hypothetical protein [Paenibacillus radicis (ex Gao et al. 2016)]GGG75083.1 hypothetical protein GCM10010918_34110 [Paenibacillus radicis (ex Gao et al. 2016)]